MARKRVLITGAAGYLSRQLLPVFRERYDLVLLDRRKPHDIDGIIEVDLVNPDIDTYREHFKGVDAIVHNTRSTRPGVNTGAPRLERRCFTRSVTGPGAEAAPPGSKESPPKLSPGRW